MVFSSYLFWAFFAVVIALYHLLRHRWQNRMLLVASYVFYGAWDWRFLSLILISTVVNYFAAWGIGVSASTRRRRLFCALSICVSLGLLGVFKYYGFFATATVDLLGALGFNASLPLLKIVLPVGISFYTFQTMSYTIDVYRGVTRPVRSFLDFALYVCFFPQLVAGPIERSSRLMPQIVNPRPRTEGDFAKGLYLVLMGLFKKVIVADSMALIVDAIFAADTGDLTGAECLVGVWAFAFQIYGDFSGYSSIARGIAKWMNFDLMTNFRMPYLSRSPSEFWSRWHISLSTWLRDYLYIPLGGNRGGGRRTYRNLMITMLLGGLWHGAGWTYLAWGLFHGMILCVYRAVSGRKPKTATASITWRDVAAGKVMFHLVCFGWLLFRADTIQQAWNMLTLIFTAMNPTMFSTFVLGMIVFFCAPLMLFEYWLGRKDDPLRLLTVHWGWRAAAYSYMALSLVIFQPVVHSGFIYFDF